ncbi:menaquinone-dependent protoporphyrinogen oxidase [Blastococcus aggregatus]|uniref:Menaquinone-dependent protoporphyrinogen oxidase n=1 Tax=Blastococcus aggregatus TaxID=38502 RepID=A0A285V746_9ACTN|nr:flavodoxin domain-containing protein [Blastococcus aggregatus]SOC49879.1 menaquinone-dependent protoporphyrinogen oxidase [Blastococcus aggregatus]
MSHRPDGRAPRVLVAFASRHGSTREIAAAISRGLTGSAAGRATGLTTRLAPVEQRPDPVGFDAVVLGSAVYDGRWLEPAVCYALEAAPVLHGRSTWLFSSGLAAGPARLPQGVADADRLAVEVGARGHRLFAGRLERHVLSAAERAAWHAPLTGAGDFRDWPAIGTWSEQVAADCALGAALPVAG